jgi:hypothetical protein
MTQQTVLTETEINRLQMLSQVLLNDPSDFNRAARAIEQAVLQQVLSSPQAQAMRWQPIETAPKNGRSIFVIRRHSHLPNTAIYNTTMCWFEDLHSGDHLHDLTHWMPLPAPPADAAMEKQK